ncbi:PTS glucitol/sorbitol transporter subunit IIA [Gracilibacillus suaedae]|uniref:PTS glucitol/sorbitol transporter subunit IIA n=1 Tax=Gracilibacillus suaedae TaxID=2820273 RepID=UPI001ABE0296|nr:PTS glucitol/sorbitol transporter subunit IIA [Gracilibacillus suaedae]
MSVIYESKIVEVGQSCSEMLDAEMLIIFHEDVPAELKDVAAIHLNSEWASEVVVGDILQIGNQEYVIKKVGEKANETLQSLGHCTINFGMEGADLPGTITVDGEGLPIIEEGNVIKFKRI